MSNIPYYSGSSRHYKPLPRLVTSGQFFKQENGEPFTAIQCSDFHLLGRYLSNENIDPVLQQRATIGFNMLRVWTRYRLAEFGIGDSTLSMHPDMYDRIPSFLDRCDSYGFYVEFTAYVGPDPRGDYDEDHYWKLGEKCKLKKNSLIEFVNEDDQHHIPLEPYHPIDGVLCSHGSNGAGSQPVTPLWDYFNMHYNSLFEWWRKVGHNTMEVSHDKPGLGGETTRYPDNDNSLAHAYDAAAGAALLCGGSCYHSVSGKSSVLFKAGVELDAAKQWVAGAKSVPLHCQNGNYWNEIPPDPYLRKYHRGNDLSCEVNIRK